MRRPSKTEARNGADRDEYICMMKDDSEETFGEQSIPLYQLTRLPSDAVLSREPKNYVTSSSRKFDRQGEKQSPIYMLLMPDKIKDVRPYEMLGAKNPERSSGRSFSWLDRYLPRRITNMINKYLNDVFSDGLDYEDPLAAMSASSEVTSNEETLYSSAYSDESGESGRKVPRNVADEVDCESREEDQQHGVKSKESHGYLKMKDRMRLKERQALMPEEEEKTRRKRRQTEIDEVKFRRLSNKIFNYADCMFVPICFIYLPDNRISIIL